MADGGFRIATAYVAIEPTDEGFRTQLAAKIKEAAEGAAVKVRLDTDADGLAEKVRTQLAAANTQAQVHVKLDEADVESVIEKVHAEAAAADADAHVHVKVDEASAEELVAEVRAEAAAADAETHVHVKVDETGTDLRTGLEQLAESTAADADQAGARIGDALADGLFRDAQGRLRNASGQFASDAEKLAAGFDDAGASADNAGQRMSGAGKKASDAGKDASSSASGWKTFADGASSAGSAMMIVSGISLVPTLAAIPGLALGAAASLGTLAGAFLGVAQAFKDYGATQGGGGGGGVSGAQQAATAYSDAVAIRNAEQAITDARTQAARSAVSSAEQIANAEQGVQDAERNAATAAQNSADQIAAAKQRVDQAAYAGIQAEQAYTNAVYNEQQAQQSLVNARQAAANQLVDSQNAAKDAHLATEQAVLNERQAQRALDAANGNSLLTADQKLAAQLAVEQATQAVADAKQREKEATQAATTATTNGVDNAPSVLAAQHALEMATQATANAQHGVQQAAQSEADAQTALARANQAAANQQVASAEQVGKAQQQLADAERTAAQQRQDSAQAIARAEQNLTDTIKEQQLAAAATGASGSAAVNKFAQDMQKLSPAGRDFVNQLISMKGEFHQLALDAQTATLPGFTQMLKDSEHLLPTVEVGIKNTGKALSDTAAAAGKLFANPEFDASAMQFTQIVTGGFATVVSALPPLLSAVVSDGVRAAPLINSVATGVHDLVASGLPDFLSGLTVNAGGAAQGVGALFRAVDGLLGPVGTLAGAASGALGPALVTLEPGFIKLVDDIEAGLLPLMPQLSTDLVDVAQILDQLFTILEPIIPVIGSDLGAALRAVDPLLKDTAQFLQENQRWLTPVAEGILAVVVATKAWNTATSLAKDGIKMATSVIEKFSSAAESAAGKAGKVTDALGSAEGMTAKLGLVGAVTGGVAAGIVGVGEALNHLVYQSSGAATSVDQFDEALLHSEASTDNVTTKLDDYAQMAQKVGAANKNVTDSMAQTGLGLIELGRGIGGTTADMKNYDASLAALVSDGNANRAAAIVAQLAAATDAHGNHLVDVNALLPQYKAALEHSTVANDAAARAAGSNADATDRVSLATQHATGEFQHMSDQLSQTQALQQFKADLFQLKDAADQNGTSLDNNTAAGLANENQFANLAGQIENTGKQLHDAGDSNDYVSLKMQDMVTQLETTAGQFGYNKGQVDAYLKSIGLIPKDLVTNFSTPGLADEQKALDDILNTMATINGNELRPFTIKTAKHAAGGLISGPGTGTSDSILSRVSNGEFIVNAATVAQPGVLAALTALNNGTGGVSAVQQVGGTTPQTGAPTINLNYYGSTLPSVEEQHVIMRDLTLAVRPGG